MPAVTSPAACAVDIIDIRRDKTGFDIKSQILHHLNPAPGCGPRCLPTLLLYDTKGLQLFEEITYLDEYYLTNCEIGLLKQASTHLAQRIPEGSILVELGSGNLRKVCLLLQAFEDLAKRVDYYALDLSERELQRTLAHVPPFKSVSCHGLLGTYDDGREWLKQPAILTRSKCIIHLGSSIGNFARDEAAEFVQEFADLLNPDTDAMIMGIDSCKNPDKIYKAYNDSKGVTHQFNLNCLVHANKLFEEQIFNVDEWRSDGVFIYDSGGGRHQASLSPICQTTVLGTVIEANERIKIEQSLKYSRAACNDLFRLAGLRQEASWWDTSDDSEYGLHFLKRAPLPLSCTPEIYASSPVPTLTDWCALWHAWDTVTLAMLPQTELQAKPIRLRNACIFYLGHIPAFLDIQLTRALGTQPTAPASFQPMFERGIDPDVDNPAKCHHHSAVPDEWPPAEDIAEYQASVRQRVRQLYSEQHEELATEKAPMKASLGRALWISFEHESMHLETILYMMLQSDKTIPPPVAPRPDFEDLAARAVRSRVPNLWFEVPEQTITIGMDDDEDKNDSIRYFGWDNEKPSRQVTVHAFQAQGRPITNQEYAQYMYSCNCNQLPASWSILTEQASNGTPNGTTNENTNGGSTNSRQSSTSTTPTGALPDSFLNDKAVRTVYGLVPLRLALDWPVWASYDELARCASWMGGRIPTFEEARSIYAFVEAHRKQALMQSRLAKKVPAVNGHLVNDGVEETPPYSPSDSDSEAVLPSQPESESVAPLAAESLFIDLASANVGFRHWHPQPVTHRGGVLAGQSDMGGVWECTSSVLEPHAGFKPMPLYPAYTADFFDGKHHIVLGGSWATHPRIAGRRSFVNWYQHNYPYAWTGARLVRDV
ncbi:hypothetical protein CDD82_3500 [Ophiocordyceps australis]|uniref:Ergothioneine biosynthesis protein 1 n=1 Tax=Ophiocordyceps australis TaxID=1399860 RepID=A0A2C5Z8U5_9HYPO|nr:hypothetical protein CDD82_3500 [Ophiocordyceps australis]